MVTLGTAVRLSQFGVWYDPRHNTQFQNFMQDGNGWHELLTEFAYPYILPNDTIFIRFPFTEWGRPFSWTDVDRCRINRPQWYESIKRAAEHCLANNFRLLMYMPLPTEHELGGKVNLMQEFPHATVGLDASIGSLVIPGMDKFRANIGHPLVLEPGWDRNTTLDWPYPIVIASDLYQLVSDQDGANWVWPLPVDGSGPEIIMMQHHDISGDYVAGVKEWAKTCRGNHWSTLVAGDLFHNNGVTRADIWE